MMQKRSTALDELHDALGEQEGSAHTHVKTQMEALKQTCTLGHSCKGHNRKCSPTSLHACVRGKW